MLCTNGYQLFCNTKIRIQPMNTIPRNALLFLSVCILAWLASNAFAVPEKAQDAIDETKEELSENLDDFEDRFQENRLINREPADILAWVFMGMLVGALAGTFSPLGTTLIARFLRLLLGLLGAFIGGMVVRIGDIDFGWPIIEIPLVELLFSLLGAIALVALLRGGGKYLKHRARRSVIKPIIGKGD